VAVVAVAAAAHDFTGNRQVVFRGDRAGIADRFPAISRQVFQSEKNLKNV